MVPFSKGRIDVAIRQLLRHHAKLGQDCASNFPGWWEGCGQGHNHINIAKCNEMPKTYQAAVVTACGDAWEWVLGKYDYGNPAALKRVVASGAILRPFPEPIMEAC